MFRHLLFLAFLLPLAAQDHVSYLPHYTFKDGDWVTELGLHNPTLLSQTVTVKAYDNAGNAQLEHQLFLRPNGGYAGTVHQIIPQLTSETGWLELHAETDQIRGMMAFRAVTQGGSSTLPLNRDSHKNLVFTALRETNEWVSGFAVVNTSDQTATLDLQLLDWQGKYLATKKVSLDPKAKLVEQVAPFFEATAGLPERLIMRISSSTEVTGFALAFHGDSDQIVAVPADEYTPGEGAAQFADQCQTLLNSSLSQEANIHGLLMGVESPSRNLKWFGAAGMADPNTGEVMTSEHPFRLASVGKTMTAATIQILADEGKLGLDDLASKHLAPEVLAGLHVFEGHDYGNEITLRQLLTHTSGLGDHFFDGDDNNDGFPDLLFRLFTQPDEFWDAQSVLAYARQNTKALAPPGQIYHYSDLGYVLLGLIAEKVTGQPLHEVYRERIFTPLGMDDSWLEYRETPTASRDLAHTFFGDTDYTDFNSASADWAGGGQAATMEDLTTFIKAVIDGRLFKDPQALLKPSDFGPTDEGTQYGLGLEVFTAPGYGSFFGHEGFSGAYMYYWKEADLYLVGTMNQAFSDVKAFLLGLIDINDGGWLDDRNATRIQTGITPVGTVNLSHVSIENEGPTVVFESGLGNGKEAWKPVFSQIGAVASTFAYDRAGYGESSFAGGERAADVVVEELRALLLANQKEPPYVLVGHSLGGLYMQYYARTFPEEVAGIVFVDTSYPLQSQRLCTDFPDLCSGPDEDYEGLPEPIYSESLGIEPTGLLVNAAGPYPDVPATVLSAGIFPDPLQWLAPWWQGLHAEIAAAAGANQIIAPHSAHYIQRDNPLLVIDSIQQILQSLR